MSKLHFEFGEIDTDETISRLANLFGTSVDKGLIQIPPSYGTGFIRKLKIENGLVMRVWDFDIISSITFNKTPFSYIENEKYFHIGYLLVTDTLALSNGIFPKQMHLPHGMNIVFFSGDIEMNFEIEKGTGLHAIDIAVTYRWLKEAFVDSDTTISEFIKELNKRPAPTMLLESCSPSEYRLISDIYTAAGAELKSHLHIKAEVLLLIAEFFKKISSNSTQEVLESNVLYYDKIILAEKMLTEIVEGIFPGVDNIAKRVGLSESTLKRYFKTVFNKSLYKHYLEIKMEHAKRLMLEKPLSVNEAAAILNYEKVSSFIETFKKHHGYSPGQLKRKSA